LEEEKTFTEEEKMNQMKKKVEYAAPPGGTSTTLADLTKPPSTVRIHIKVVRIKRKSR
jgi:hypothetical protein